jgi:hypothetical protein
MRKTSVNFVDCRRLNQAASEPFCQVGNFARVLRLSFDDTNFLNPKISDRARSKPSDAFTEGKAQDTRASIEALSGEKLEREAGLLSRTRCRTRPTGYAGRRR